MADAVVAESKPASSENNDMLVKAIVLWGLAPIGYLFYMNDTDPLVKFYAKQSLYYGIAVVVILVVCGIIPIVGWCVGIILVIAHIVIAIFMFTKMRSGVKVKLPVIGDMAEKA